MHSEITDHYFNIFFDIKPKKRFFEHQSLGAQKGILVGFGISGI